MAHDLDVAHIASKLYPNDTVSIGVDSVKKENKIIYNISVIVRSSGNKACIIWTKDIEDFIIDNTYRDMKELNLLSNMYHELYPYIKEHEVNFSAKIHKNWFSRFKYEERNNKLKISFCPCSSFGRASD